MDRTGKELLSPVSWVQAKNDAPQRYLQKSQRGEKKTTLPEAGGIFSLFQDVLLTPENIPESITATYADDYDIFYIHNIILCKLSYEYTEIPPLLTKKDTIEKRLCDKLKVIERKKLITQLDEIMSQINAIKEGLHKKNYLEESRQLLQRYQQLGPIIRIRSFLSPTETREISNNTQQEERLQIIYLYLEIAKKYIPINIVRIVTNDKRCPGCGDDLVALDPEADSIGYCKECGYEQHNFNRQSYFHDTTGTGKKISTSDYEDKENFLKALECYLGEQQAPPASLFHSLDEWARKYNHPSKEAIRRLPLNYDGTRGEYGKSMLLQALSDMGYADYYKDIKLIGHSQWGWRLPTLTQQERDMIIKDYDETQKIFKDIPKERKSSLNTQYRLYRHLQARKIPCSSSDFKLPTTPSILEEQDIYWREMVKVIPDAEFISLK